MFIAHLPSGYILAKFLDKKLKQTKISKKAFFTIIMIGAVFPDIDLFYFYLFDNRSVHHHKYFLHWFSVLLSSAALLHISLDTFVGDVWLFAPFIDKPYVFFEVTSRYQPWWLNFIFHWSFFVEIIICFIAFILYLKK